MKDELAILAILACQMNGGGCNPGALVACQEMAETDEARTVAVLDQCIRRGIDGEAIYLVWNDECGRDAAKTLAALETKGTLSEARQFPKRSEVWFAPYLGIPYGEAKAMARHGGFTYCAARDEPSAGVFHPDQIGSICLVTDLVDDREVG